MRRALLLGCALLGLGLPAATRADTPGYRAVGPPASLNSVAYAMDGTIYGTTAWARHASVTNPVVVWRSSDHGRTWSAAYRRPFGWTLQVVSVSPADRDTVYVLETLPFQDTGSLVRVDARTGRSVPLSLGSLLGVDAAGTAYGVPRSDLRTRDWWLVRCPRRADTCTKVPVPVQPATGRFYALVDPNSAGVLVTPAKLSYDAPTTALISRDSGATWREGGSFVCCNLRFGGPGRETIYAYAANSLAVSYDAGFTWVAARPVPTGTLVVGAHPAAVFGSVGPGSPLLVSGDDGATVRTVPTPIGGQPLADPTDPARMLLADVDDTRSTDDGGATWREVADPQFGVQALDSVNTAGSGDVFYSVARASIWSSRDAGVTWTRVRRPAGELESHFAVSRDDPRTAYAWTYVADAAGIPTTGLIRTRDGGLSWQPIAMSEGGPVAWITPGDPLHVYALGNYVGESLDGGATWTFPAPQADWCFLETWPDPASATGQRLRCNGFFQPLDPLRPLPSPAPWAIGEVASPDAPGAIAVAASKTRSFATQPLLGELQADWTWTSLLVPTGAYGPDPATSDAVTAWPSPAGTTWYAFDAKPGTTWVRRGTGRWWRLRVAGSDVTVFSALGATRALVGMPGQFGERGVVDLEHPSLGAPVIGVSPAGFTCGIPWTAADAETTAYAWLRDGTPIAGATGAVYAAAANDGLGLTCRVTAHTDFGASAVDSQPYALRYVAAAPPARVVPKARGGHARTVKLRP